jgi:cystathionine beta-lyase/cystathionine gamma-synthase
VSVETGLTPEKRAASSVIDSLVRVSVGLEAPIDLITYLEQALAP